MMLMDSNATNVGRSLVTFAGTLVTDAEIVNSISDVFGPKSTGTTLKRTNAMWRFAQWLHQQSLGSPFIQPEHVVYRYVCFLKESGAGPTTASHFLESLQFLNSLLDFFCGDQGVGCFECTCQRISSRPICGEENSETC